MSLLEDFKKARIEKAKETAVEANRYFNDFDDAAKFLVQCHQNGENVMVNFNTKKLYSVEIETIDEAYVAYFGMTKDDFEKKQEESRREWAEKEAKREAEAKEKIPGWIERGKTVIMPSTEETWQKCVEVRAGDLYHGADLENAIQIMEALHAGKSMEEALQIFDAEKHSGMSGSIVKSILLSFHKDGVDFYRAESAARGIELKPVDEIRLDLQQKENNARFGTYDPEVAKTDLLYSLKATQSWLSPEMIMDLLTEEQQKKLEDVLKQDPDISFVVRQNENGSFEFREFFAFKEPVKFEVNIDKINLEKLAIATEKAMIPHLNYGRFHDTTTIKGRDMEGYLSRSIEIAHLIAKSESEKGLESNLANDMLSTDKIEMKTEQQPTTPSTDEKPVPGTEDIGDDGNR